MTVPVTALFGGIRGTIAAGVAALALVAAGIFGVLWQLADSRADRLAAESKNYRDVNKANGATIEDLVQKIRTLVAARAAEKEAAKAAGDRVDAEKSKIAADLAATRQELADVYARSPAARAWGSAGVPRDVADRLPRPD